MQSPPFLAQGTRGDWSLGFPRTLADEGEAGGMGIKQTQ